MRIGGYESEKREEFYASGAFELLKPFIHHLTDLGDPDQNIVDALGKEQTDLFCRKACRIIHTLFTMVDDARQDIEAMKEAAQNGKH